MATLTWSYGAVSEQQNCKKEYFNNKKPYILLTNKFIAASVFRVSGREFPSGNSVGDRPLISNTNIDINHFSSPAKSSKFGTVRDFCWSFQCSMFFFKSLHNVLGRFLSANIRTRPNITRWLNAFTLYEFKEKFINITC